MKRVSRAWPLYQQLMALFFVALIPFFALNLFTSMMASRRLHEQRESQLDFQLNAQLENFDDELGRIHRAAQVFLMDDGETRRFALTYPHLSSYKLGTTVADIYQSLGKLSTTSDLIEDVEIYMPGIERSIALKNYYEDDVPPELRAFYESYLASGRYGIFWGQDRINVLVTSPVDVDHVPLYYLNIAISSAKVLSLFSSFDEAGGVALVGPDWRLGDVPANGGYLRAYRSSTTIDADMVAFTSIAELNSPIRGFTALTIATLCLAALVIFVIRFYLSSVISRPFKKLLSLFKRVEEGDLDVSIAPQAFSGELAVVFDRFQHMISQIHALIDQTVKQREDIQRAEYKQLEAQIAPHFLYNSFNVLRHCLRAEDYETAARLVKHLGDYFNYLTYNESDERTMSEEYQHACAYLEIQKIRFGERINVEIDPLPHELQGIRMPRLTLQPLIENIFKHGAREYSYATMIRIGIKQESEAVIICVYDNGAGMEAPDALQRTLDEGVTLPEHSGLTNIARRLKHVCGSGARVTVHSELGRFFEARIQIPISEEERHRD